MSVGASTTMFPHHPCTGSPALGPLWKALQKEAVVPALPRATVQPGQPEESSILPHQQWPWGQRSQKQQRCSFSIRDSQPRLQPQPLLEQPASGEEGKVTARTCSLAHLRHPWGTTELTGVSEGGWYLSLTHGRAELGSSYPSDPMACRHWLCVQCLRGPQHTGSLPALPGKEL